MEFGLIRTPYFAIPLGMDSGILSFLLFFVLFKEDNSTLPCLNDFNSLEF
jgi:hypothetical protein